MINLEITSDCETQKISLDTYTSGRGHLAITDKRGKTVCVCLDDFNRENISMLIGLLGLSFDGDE